jgi:RNA polymerase sigma-70 factor (ECF subfamily)
VRIPYRVPHEAELPGRRGAVLAVVYLIFNEGYTASSGESLVRDELCAEAVRLGRLLAALMPDEPEVLGLLALMLLIESRRQARTGPRGELVRLADQDRSRWDAGLVTEGQDLVRRCLRRNRPGPYQVQAAIQAVHSDAPAAADTDWRQVVALYDQLLALTPSPVVAVHRTVALAERDGPAAGLAALEALGTRAEPGERAEPGTRAEPERLRGYHLFHAVRADLLRRCGRPADAAAAYRVAIAGTGNAAERASLRAALLEVTGEP